jgi:citrate lyase alpha subunit
MYEAPTIIGTCINCIAPGSLGATLALVVIGAGIAVTAERRKLARVRSDK